MSVALSEKTTALDQLSVAHRTIQGKLERKISEHENLSLQNDEVCGFSVSQLCCRNMKIKHTVYFYLIVLQRDQRAAPEMSSIRGRQTISSIHS